MLNISKMQDYFQLEKNKCTPRGTEKVNMHCRYPTAGQYVVQLSLLLSLQQMTMYT